VAWGTLSAWVKQAEPDAGLRSDGLTTAEREEVRRLRRENRILRECQRRFEFPQIAD
jgi:transposase